MLRCDQPAGRFKVSFAYLDTLGAEVKEEYIADIGTHAPIRAVIDGKDVLVEDIPRASQKKPFVGELCVHELAWLRYLPGKTYSVHRRYTVEALKPAPPTA